MGSLEDWCAGACHMPTRDRSTAVHYASIPSTNPALTDAIWRHGSIHAAMLPHGAMAFRVHKCPRVGVTGRLSASSTLPPASKRRCPRRWLSAGQSLFPSTSTGPDTLRAASLKALARDNGADAFDLILVGSGNGACGFLTRYLEPGAGDSAHERILVLEEGVDYFEASDISHQINWTRSFSRDDIYKLHKAETPDGKPIITGRACVMGGGGSINYTMVHEANAWLARNVGGDSAYWADVKTRLNARFQLSNPSVGRSAITQHVMNIAGSYRFRENEDQTGWIPNYPDDPPAGARLLHPFPTQFNEFGQRVHSGVSLVDWSDPRLTLRTLRRVEEVVTQRGSDGVRATGVRVRNKQTGEEEVVGLKDGGKLVLCAGSQSPQILLKHATEIGDGAVGHQVTDHVLLPLGLYVVDKRHDPTGRDNYVPVFATTEYAAGGPDDHAIVATLDFFAGNFQDLWYFLSHLLLSFTPNFVKRRLADNPSLFLVVKSALTVAIRWVNATINFLGSGLNFLKGNPWEVEYDLIMPIVKFNTGTEGKYSRDNAEGRSHITLGFFMNNEDAEIARTAIKDHLPLLNELGDQPNWFIKCIFQSITKIPYEEKEVDEYVKSYSENSLLSQQHLSGGCLFGAAINKGEDKPADTGKVKGTENIYVADLSTVPLPRVSPQMTAYIIGFHVANKWREDCDGLRAERKALSSSTL